jgi:hypothetical protein
MLAKQQAVALQIQVAAAVVVALVCGLELEVPQRLVDLAL